LICAATAVRADGLPTQAISLSVPTFRLSAELKARMPLLLRETAEHLRGELGIPIDPASGERLGRPQPDRPL
jgi:DNA-binding IclR family transcriptional regulator